jgi:hypothetical protein
MSKPLKSFGPLPDLYDTLNLDHCSKIRKWFPSIHIGSDFYVGVSTCSFHCSISGILTLAEVLKRNTNLSNPTNIRAGVCQGLQILLPISLPEIQEAISAVFTESKCYVVVYDFVPMLATFAEFGISPPDGNRILDIQAARITGWPWTDSDHGDTLVQLCTNIRRASAIPVPFPCIAQRRWEVRHWTQEELAKAVSNQVRGDQFFTLGRLPLTCQALVHDHLLGMALVNSKQKFDEFAALSYDYGSGLGALAERRIRLFRRNFNKFKKFKTLSRAKLCDL